MIQQDLLKPVLEAVIQLDHRYQNKMQQYEQQIEELEQEVSELQMLNRRKDERIAELECLVNPFSSDGRAICNSEFD